MMNGVSGSDSDGYNHWSEMKPAQPKSLSPPQPQKQLSDSYSNTLPVRKNVTPKNSYASGEALALLPGAVPGAVPRAVPGSAHRRAPGVLVCQGLCQAVPTGELQGSG